MKFLLVLCFVFFLSSICKAQSDTSTITNKKISSKIKELHEMRVDTIICYYIDCIGGVHLSEEGADCTPFYKKYLTWHYNGKCILQRFD